MDDQTPPRWRRRKTARPAEIVSAALAVFAEKGFAAARLEEIARRAGVSKGALYLYFETKEDLFAAVVRQAVAPNLETLTAAVARYDGEFADLARLFLPNLARLAASLPVGAVLKMIIGESRNFPGLARIWRESLVDPAFAMLSAAIAAAQARGELRAGDPRAMVLSLVGPLLMGVLWGETFVPVGGAPFDLEALAAQHLETVLNGMLIKEPSS